MKSNNHERNLSMATARVKRVPQEVLDLLGSIEFEGEAARLTCGQLDRKMYLAVNDALEACGGKWNKKVKAHLFDGDARDSVESLIETGEYTSAQDAKQLFGFFETPDELATETVGLLGLNGKPLSILEPSAGKGRLIRAIDPYDPEGATHKIVAVEIQPEFKTALQDGTTEVVIGDFLGMTPKESDPFDRVVMNPPYAKQADIDHVLHAWKFLAPGGRLVALMSSGWTFRTNRKSTEFQRFVAEHGNWYANEAGAFKESGTMVNTVTVVLNKD